MGVAHSGWAPKMDEEEERAAEAASLEKHHGTSPDKPSAPTPTADPTAEVTVGSQARTERATAEAPESHAQAGEGGTAPSAGQKPAEAGEGPEKEGGEG